jgi:hypothetical protein
MEKENKQINKTVVQRPGAGKKIRKSAGKRDVVNYIYQTRKGVWVGGWDDWKMLERNKLFIFGP